MAGIAYVPLPCCSNTGQLLFSIELTLLLSIPCRKTIQGGLLLLLVIESLMCTWGLMYLEETHMVVECGMYVICVILIFI